MKLESDNGQSLISELEKKRGGKITWKTFSLFYADNNGNIIENGALLYKIENTYWIEDFEKIPSIFGIKIGQPKNYKYEKFERYFMKDDIVETKSVMKKAALNFVEKRTSEIKKAGIIAGFFGEKLTMLKLKDGSTVFLQLLDSDTFVNNLQK